MNQKEKIMETGIRASVVKDAELLTSASGRERSHLIKTLRTTIGNLENYLNLLLADGEKS